jgi:hypothetical protein
LGACAQKFVAVSYECAHQVRNENELDEPCGNVPRFFSHGVIIGVSRSNRGRYAPDPDLPSNTVDVLREFRHFRSDGYDRSHERDGIGLE